MLYKRMHQQSHSLNVWYKINVYDENTPWTVAPHDILFYCSVLMILFRDRMNPPYFKPGPYVVLILFFCMIHISMSTSIIFYSMWNFTYQSKWIPASLLQHHQWSHSFFVLRISFLPHELKPYILLHFKNFFLVSGLKNNKKCVGLDLAQHCSMHSTFC